VDKESRLKTLEIASRTNNLEMVLVLLAKMTGERQTVAISTNGTTCNITIHLTEGETECCSFGLEPG